MALGVDSASNRNEYQVYFLGVKAAGKGHDIIEREVLDWNPQGQRKRGRPKQTWRRSIHNEALEEGKSWGEVKQLAGNRIRWRFVDVLCP